MKMYAKVCVMRLRSEAMTEARRFAMKHPMRKFNVLMQTTICWTELVANEVVKVLITENEK